MLSVETSEVSSDPGREVWITGELKMFWARLLAFMSPEQNQELLLRNEYLAAENRILGGQSAWLYVPPVLVS